MGRASSLSIFKLFDAATLVPIAGPTLMLEEVYSVFTVQYGWVETGDRDVSVFTMSLDGSLDEATWFSLGTDTADANELLANAGMFHVVDKAVRFVRANITAITPGGASGTVTVTIRLAAV